MEYLHRVTPSRYFGIALDRQNKYDSRGSQQSAEEPCAWSTLGRQVKQVPRATTGIGSSLPSRQDHVARAALLREVSRLHALWAIVRTLRVASTHAHSCHWMVIICGWWVGSGRRPDLVCAIEHISRGVLRHCRSVQRGIMAGQEGTPESYHWHPRAVSTFGVGPC